MLQLNTYWTPIVRSYQMVRLMPNHLFLKIFYKETRKRESIPFCCFRFAQPNQSVRSFILNAWWDTQRQISENVRFINCAELEFVSLSFHVNNRHYIQKKIKTQKCNVLFIWLKAKGSFTASYSWNKTVNGGKMSEFKMNYHLCLIHCVYP